MDLFYFLKKQTFLSAEDSQLSLPKRLYLLIYKPNQAFSLFSRIEKKATAWIIFLAYFIIKLPVVIQRPYLEGNLQKYDSVELAMLLFAALLLGMLATLLFFSILAFVIKPLLRSAETNESGVKEILLVFWLSLAPQLVLIFEWPLLAVNYDNAETWVSVIILRLVLSLFSLRTLYWGMRIDFQASALRAGSIIALPAGVVMILLLALF